MTSSRHLLDPKCYKKALLLILIGIHFFSKKIIVHSKLKKKNIKNNFFLLKIIVPKIKI